MFESNGSVPCTGAPEAFVLPVTRKRTGRFRFLRLYILCIICINETEIPGVPGTAAAHICAQMEDANLHKKTKKDFKYISILNNKKYA